MLHPDDYDQVVSSINSQIRENDDQNDAAHYRIIRKDGSVRWVDDYGHYTNTQCYGGIYYVFLTDVTERHNQAEITEEQKRLLIKQVQSAAEIADMMASANALFSNMPAMSFSKDATTGVYLACNQPFAEYAHRNSPDEVIGLTDYDIFDPVTAAHFVEDDKKTLTMDKPYVFLEDVPNAAGTEIRNLQTTKLKFRDASAGFARWVCVWMSRK